MKKRKLKVLRAENDLTQEELAKQLGVSVATYNLIENGKRDGSKQFWLGIQNVYKLGDAEVWQMQK